ncbi:MAG: LLM class flavin-dependent oxidoreductase [Ilumatobacteraceae bacterium]
MIEVDWFLPTGGDSRDILPEGEAAHRRRPDHDYLAEVARACDRLGFHAVLTPCGTGCEDAWVATASLLPLTRRLKFLVAFRPTLLTPTLAAQMASTYQRMSGGRLLVNIVTGAEPVELARFGVHEDKSTRYDRTGEFIGIMRGAWTDSPVDHSGTFYDVRGATTREQPDPIPAIYFGGASPEALRVAAEHADVYLTWGEPPTAAAGRIAEVRQLATLAGRSLRYGIRFHVIARPTADDAWAAAATLLSGVSDEARRAAAADFATTRSEGQRRLAASAAAAAESDVRMEIHPNVWAGIGLVRGGVGTALVGSFDEVADRIEEYHEVGFDAFILSGYPHLEEAYWFGEGVMPILRRRGLVPDDGPADAPVFSFR